MTTQSDTVVDADLPFQDKDSFGLWTIISAGKRRSFFSLDAAAQAQAYWEIPKGLDSEERARMVERRRDEIVRIVNGG